MDSQDNQQEEQNQLTETINGGNVGEGVIKDLGKGNEDKLVPYFTRLGVYSRGR